jgi:5-methyltetrahydrofolate--homocysteine methyltransferase
VHDIGKNIAGVVLACNNFEIIDLGVMVSCATILAKAKELKADIIGLSGLITPSLDEMVSVATEMERQGFKIPLILGGATTSENHTAVKIAPCYSGAVMHVKDASRGVAICRNLIDQKASLAFIAENKVKQQALRKNFEQDRASWKLVSLAEARRGKMAADRSISKPKKPAFLGVRQFKDFDISRIRTRIDWSFFLLAWGFKGRYPSLLKDPKFGTEATKLFDDAQAMLDEIAMNKLLTCNGVAGIFPANSIGDDIEIYTDERRKHKLTTVFTLRQQVAKTDPNQPFYALADFIAPQESGIKDYLGGFAVTGGIGMENAIKYVNNDEYKVMLLKTLADRLAEGFAEVLHEDVRKELWGYDPKEDLSNEAILAGHYRGIRPAVGYPACPDHTEKVALFNILRASELTGIELTESLMMMPAASVCGYYFAHPDACYFPIGHIDQAQLEDYAHRKGMPIDEAQKWLAQIIQ